MANKADLMRCLSAMSPEDIFQLLNAEGVSQLVQRCSSELSGRYDEIESTISDEALSPATVSDTTKTPSTEKALRPLNAFMAFRSYYLKIFPDVQQKTASGFLTTLWNQDPVRNKWALIAKVYSFVRDEVGKDRLSLSHFLSFACPTMSIIEPTKYLDSLGWTIATDADGTQKLVQNLDKGTIIPTELQSNKFPDTEISLLASLIDLGFMPAEGQVLMGRLSNSNSGMMATTSVSNKPPVPYTDAKSQFMEQIRANPEQAAKDLFGPDYQEAVSGELGVRICFVSDIATLDDCRMEPAYPSPQLYYNYQAARYDPFNGSDVPLRVYDLPDGQTFDIDDPFDLDMILGDVQGLQQVDSQPMQTYDPRQDFNFIF